MRRAAVGLVALLAAALSLAASADAFADPIVSGSARPFRARTRRH
ncbi:MAG TPA: hypothetical protein VGH43_09515 [Jatrophihabitans sp.]|jgi:hypothetical protein